MDMFGIEQMMPQFGTTNHVKETTNHVKNGDFRYGGKQRRRRRRDKNTRVSGNVSGNLLTGMVNKVTGCPPGSNLIIDMTDPSRRPKCGNIGRKTYLTNIQKAELKGEMSRAAQSKLHDLTGYITPYMVNVPQRRLLSYLVGKDTINEMEAYNTLVYSGIIPNTCPPGKETYLDAMSGRPQCRDKIRKVVVFGENITCPERNKNPYAIEKYIDYDGQAKCRIPVLHGKFTCPPKSRNIDDMMRTKHVTLPDGTGICIRPQIDIDRETFVPHNLIYPVSVFDKMNKFINLYEQQSLDGPTIRSLNDAFLMSKGIPLLSSPAP